MLIFIRFLVNLPTVEELKTRYGAAAVDNEDCLKAFLSKRATLPYSLKDAVDRVEACLLYCLALLLNLNFHPLLFSQVIVKQAEAEERRSRLARVNQALAQASLAGYNSLSYSQRGVLDACGGFGDLLRSGKVDMPLSDAIIQQAVAALVGALSVSCTFFYR